MLSFFGHSFGNHEGGKLLLVIYIPVASSGCHWGWPAVQCRKRECLSEFRTDGRAELLQMYVMSSLPPNQQSLAGGIFNTVTRVCTAIGLGISASIYNAESTSKAALQTSIRPYNAVFWFCAASAGLGVLFVPFLTIGTQGQSESTRTSVNLESSESREKSHSTTEVDLWEEISNTEVLKVERCDF